MTKLYGFFLTLLFAAPGSAEFVSSELIRDDNATVIDSQWVDATVLEEPIFSRPQESRDIANLDVEDVGPAPDFEGQLRVVSEIPYSYPWVSHHTMRMRVLAEIEKEESAKKSAK